MFSLSISYQIRHTSLSVSIVSIPSSVLSHYRYSISILSHPLYFVIFLSLISLFSHPSLYLTTHISTKSQSLYSQYPAIHLST
jgi:hypothetical protein